RGKTRLGDVLGFYEHQPPLKSGPGVSQKPIGARPGAYLREIKTKNPVPERSWFNAKYWAPPANAKEFLDAIRWTADGKLVWEIFGPPSVATETYYQQDKNRYILHLVNYDFRRSPTGDITVAIHKDDVSRIAKVTQYSPDQVAPAELKF